MLHRSYLLVASVAFVLSACPSAPAPAPAAGSERGPCYGNGTCDTGLVCLSNLCVRGGLDASVDAPATDAGTADGGITDGGAHDTNITAAQDCNPWNDQGASRVCAASERCVVDLGAASGGIEYGRCRAGHGTLAAGAACTIGLDLDECTEGLACVGPDPGVTSGSGTCRALCGATGCPMGASASACMGIAGPAAGACWTRCDPSVPTDCSGGTACNPFMGATQVDFACFGSNGGLDVGDDCSASPYDGCMAGDFCAALVGALPFCSHYCRTSVDCGGSTCIPFDAMIDAGHCT